MKISLLFVGSTKTEYVESAMQLYLKRLQRFSAVEMRTTPNIKGIKKAEDQRTLEASQVLKLISNTDFVILLDEKGKSLASTPFALKLDSLKNQGTTKLVFVIAGAFGSHADLKARSNLTLSLSDFTFSHQLARVVLAEQVYRAFTIINKHPYHNEG